MAKKSWQEKFYNGKKAVVKILDKKIADMPQGTAMLIATPAIIDDYIQQIPKGNFVNMATIRKDLAITYNAHTTCPLTTGIFIRIIAEKAHEEYRMGKPLVTITPFWRVVNANSTLAKKLPCGADFIKEMQEKEGINI